MVLRDDGPAVGELADARLAGIDHRLDGEGHAGLERHAGGGLAVVEHLGLLVKLAPDAVAAELPHHREAVLLGVALDHRADVAQARARPDLLDAEPHALVRDIDQAPRLDAGLADVVHAAAVAVIAILDYGDVYVDDVAALQHALARHAMADLVV